MSNMNVKENRFGRLAIISVIFSFFIYTMLSFLVNCSKHQDNDKNIKEGKKNPVDYKFTPKLKPKPLKEEPIGEGEGKRWKSLPDIESFKKEFVTKLSAYGEYEWYHNDLPNQVSSVWKFFFDKSQEISNNSIKIKIAIRGIADARNLKDEDIKYWRKAKFRFWKGKNYCKECDKKDDEEITNRDLAFFRSCRAKIEIVRYLYEEKGIEFEPEDIVLLDPIDYTKNIGDKDKIGPDYMASEFFVVFLEDN
ncbi:hypothetical protein ACFLQP_00490 [Acidobacteriota bacterium]